MWLEDGSTTGALVLEGIGDDKVRVNSSSLDHPLVVLAGLHFHTAPIFLRCSSTRSASAATSWVSFGNGVA
jgi:hypothetical protein